MLALLAFAVPAAAAPSGSVAVGLSSHRAAARSVTVTLRLRYEMQCGNPGPGRLVVSFPAGMHVPKRIAAAHVLLAGKPVPAVSVSETRVTITLPRPQGIQCMVIAPGRTSVVFVPAAGIGNPAKAGTYPLSVRKGALVMRTRFAIGSS